MTREECQKLLTIINATYPNFNPEDLTATINSWLVFMQDYRYEEMEMALRYYVITSKSPFAPSVSELIAIASRAMEYSESDAITAWTQVRKAIKRGIYYAEEDFYSLPELAQKVVGYPEQIRSWAQMEAKEIDTVVWSNFKKSYETLQNRKQEQAMLSRSMQSLIQNTEQAMIEAN